MTSFSSFAPSLGQTSASRLCRKKARDCQRTAMTLEDPKDRRVYLKLANLWREMAYAAEQEAGALSQETAVVIAFPSNSLRLSR
jgi:hypothetical protein